jgi:hypothetical protein
MLVLGAVAFGLIVAWTDRHKILISVVTWAILIGSFVFLTLMGDSIK